ncbi:MAG: class II fructose-bisphosphate aldolase, partial [Anaerotignaceae bacterium]
MLCSLKDVLQIAEDKKIAIGAFNTPNLESLCAVIEAAETLKLPVIVQFAQCHEDLIPLDIMGPIMVERAKKASVPVCVHLDHGEDIEYIKIALDQGFTSVMYDGSTLSFEENVKNTCQVMKMAQQVNATVEAEIGSMGAREFSGTQDEDNVDDTKVYTDPKQAQDFIEQTGVHALACSFGTTHGIYKKAPQLNLEIVRQVRELANKIPIVMHGGSGVSAADFQTSIAAGVRKVNYFTYMDRAAGIAVSDYLNNL